MGDLGTIFNDITGNTGSGNSAAKLAANGYQQFKAGAAPTLNMGAYGPDATAQAQAAQINMGQANQFLPGEQQLVSQLQAQAQGAGPSLAQQQLRQGVQANLAAQLAAQASQRGNQNAGASQYELGQEAAATNQAAAGQAATLRAEEQEAAEQGLGQALGAYGGQQIGLAENQAGLTQGANLQNANALNNMAQFNTESAQAGNNAQQAQYQYGTNVAETQQNNENAAIAGQQLANQNASNAFATGLVGGAANAGGAALAHLGGGSSGGGNSSDTGWNNQGQETGAYADTAANSSAWQARGGIDYGEKHVTGEAGPEAEVPIPEMHVHVHGGDVVDHPAVRSLGSPNHPVAVVPLHADGSPKTEDMESNVRELLSHPEFQKALHRTVGNHMDTLKAALEASSRG